MNYTSLLALCLLSAAITIRLPIPTWIPICAVLLITLAVIARLLGKQVRIMTTLFFAVLATALFVQIHLPTDIPALLRLAIIICLWVMVYSTLAGLAWKIGDSKSDKSLDSRAVVGMTGNSHKLL